MPRILQTTTETMRVDKGKTQAGMNTRTKLQKKEGQQRSMSAVQHVSGVVLVRDSVVTPLGKLRRRKRRRGMKGISSQRKEGTLLTPSLHSLPRSFMMFGG